MRLARTLVASESVIIWLNGTYGGGKTTTSALVQELIPNSRVFDAEKVGETLMDITPGLPSTDNFQHWPPWRPLVVETARHVLDFTGGTLVMPMTVLVEEYWREISSGLAQHAIPVRHFVLHAEQDTLRKRIEGDTRLGPSSFRLNYLEPYAEAARTLAARRGRGRRHHAPHTRSGRPPDRGRHQEWRPGTLSGRSGCDLQRLMARFLQRYMAGSMVPFLGVVLALGGSAIGTPLRANWLRVLSEALVRRCPGSPDQGEPR